MQSFEDEADSEADPFDEFATGARELFRCAHDRQVAEAVARRWINSSGDPWSDAAAASVLLHRQAAIEREGTISAALESSLFRIHQLEAKLTASQARSFNYSSLMDNLYLFLKP